MTLLIISVITCVATIFDLWRGVVPNWLTGLGFVVVFASLLITGVPGLSSGLAAAALMLLLWLPAWSGGVLGGGDHKLLIIIGLALGLSHVLAFLLTMALAGGVQVVLWSWLRHDWNVKKQRIPYTLAMLVGLMFIVFFR